MSTEPTSKKPPRILLVEDSEDDRFFFKRALAKAQQPHELVLVSDGQEALRYLGRENGGPDGAPSPDIVFLDLKLPKFSGFEVLKWMKEHSLIEKTWVVVLSGSDEQKDRALAQELGAKDYVVKPIQVDTLRAHLQVVSNL